MTEPVAIVLAAAVPVVAGVFGWLGSVVRSAWVKREAAGDQFLGRVLQRVSELEEHIEDCRKEQAADIRERGELLAQIESLRAELKFLREQVERCSARDCPYRDAPAATTIAPSTTPLLHVKETR